MNFNFEQATRVRAGNSRVNYDLRFSEKTGKFNVSNSAHAKFDFVNNGFNVIRDNEGNIAFQIVPNDQADNYRGEGQTFSANDLADLLNLQGDAEWNLIKHEHGGDIYAMLDLISTDESNESMVDAQIAQATPEQYSDEETDTESITA